MSKRFLSYLAVHVSSAFFGMTGLMGVLTVSSAPVVAFYRCAIAASVLGVYLVVARRIPKFSRSDLKTRFAAGILMALHWVTFFLSAKTGGAALAAVSFSSFPIFLTYLEPFFFCGKIDFVKVGASLFLAFGVYLLVPEADLESPRALGVFWGVVSGLLFALLSLLYRKSESSAGGSALLFLQTAIAAAAIFPFVAASPFPAAASDWLWLLVLGMVCTPGAFGLFIHSLKNISAQSAGMIVCMEGVYGVVLAMIFLGEDVGLRGLAGASVIVGISLAVGYYDGAKEKRPTN